MRRTIRRLARGIVYTIVGLLVLVALILTSLETGWGKNQLRALIVRQANQYLTATLDIGRLSGSLLRGLELRDVRLSRDGQTIIAIDEIALNYSIRELVQPGTIIRRIRLTRPQVVGARQADGRWNLGALVKRNDSTGSGPRRPLQILSIQVIDGSVVLKDPMTFGAARVPSRFDQLNMDLSFVYAPVEWRLDFTNASWVGGPSDLTVTRLAGTIANEREGYSFHNLLVRTPQSAFVVDGRVERGGKPAVLDLHVAAERFVFQEWGVVISGLTKIPIDSAFDARLKGPLTALATELDLRSNGGAARGSVVLDTTVPGWRGAGSMTLTRLNLAPWFDRPERQSDISGRAVFDLALEIGRGVPRGTYDFTGTHAAYMGYEGDNVHVRGDITATDWRMARVTARAYGSNVEISPGTIALAAPYAFHFQGKADGVDLRNMPVTVPVPHVESTLAFEFDVTGRFLNPFIAGDARFAQSTFLGASVGNGTVGTIDTSASPVTYSGEGDVTGLDLHRYGVELQVAWLQEPRYAGTVDGHFYAVGAGAESATMTLDGGGRLARANLFSGTLSDAAVDVHIAAGSLTGSYDGRFASIDPAVALTDERFAASLTGAGRMRVHVRDLLLREALLADYDLDATVRFENSDARGVHLDNGTVTATLANSTLTVGNADAVGPLFEARGSGSIAFGDAGESRFEYDVTRADLSILNKTTPVTTPATTPAATPATTPATTPISGSIVTTGVLTGAGSSLRLAGNATVNRLEVAGVKALTTVGDYEVTFPWEDPSQLVAHVNGRSSFIEAFDQSLQEAIGTIEYAGNRITADLALSRADGTNGTVAGTVVLHPDESALDLVKLDFGIGLVRWRLLASDPAPIVRWSADATGITPMTFVDAENGDQRIELSGDWRPAGGGTLRVKAAHVFLDTLAGALERPPRYGGVVDLDATLRGTRDQPIVTGQLSITEGRVRRLTYDRLAGRVDYADGTFHVDLRLDQAPGVWLTATGSVPPSLFNSALPEKPLDVIVVSSDVSLGLLEGITNVVTDVVGQLRANVHVVGTSHDPHFTGTVELSDAGFTVAATGARYKNGDVALQLDTDRIAVSTFHLEDRNGQPLDVRGSLGTHELRVGELEIEITAQHFEVLRNEFGGFEVDASLSLLGQFEEPRLSGNISIVGGELKVDEILSRTLFQPYATQAIAPDEDVITALNPWNRLAVDIVLHSQNALRMTGENLVVSENAPLGLGSFDLRASGDLYFFKPPNQPLSLTGSLDSISGSYSFQGRRFDVYPSSSVDFRGDLNPELFISVNRVISGVETRVTIVGPLWNPELRLSSSPPLDPSDILSLIVFNTSANALSAEQQSELAVRAGTLAVGFLTSGLMTAIERSLGIDLLEIEPSTGLRSGARVTIGEEIAPGLVARFSRQFGADQYDEATLEYYITRFLRLRATFSDAASGLLAQSPFRRVERAGIDLLLFFSF